MHRCMFCTTAHALTVSPAVFFASTGTRPKRNTVPGAEMSSCASRRKNGRVSSSSSGRESSAMVAGAASSATETSASAFAADEKTAA